MRQFDKIDWKGKRPLFWAAAAFVIPVVLMWIGFACYGVFPFGTKQILVQDAWHQYYPFLVELRNKLINGESLFYTWNNGLGTNFLALAAYYCASPLNLLLPLFPEENLQIFFSLMVTVKMGLASAFAAFALQKAFRRTDPAAAALGCCYGLCSFFMGYFWNIMWLDSAALLPLVALGVVSLVREGKFKLYVVSVALSLICNFLIGLYVCIFTFFFFFAACVCTVRSFKIFLKRFFQIGVYTLIAIAMTAFVMLPVVLALQNTYSMTSNFPDWKLHESFVDVFGNFAAFGGPTSREGLPNLYCGLPCVLLGALYAVSDKVPRRQKFTAVGLLTLLILSLNISVIEYVWNGFHTTNMLPYRFSFLVSFVLVAMAFRVLPELFVDLPRWKYLLLAGVAAVLLTLCWFTHGIWVTVANAGVLAAYLAVAFLFRNNKRRMALLLCLVMAGETVASVIIGVGTVGTSDTVGYPYLADEVEQLIDSIERQDAGFYRMECVPKQSLNDPTLYGYRGLSTFSSLANVNVNYALGELGVSCFPAGNSYYNNYISSPVVNALLSMKYFIAKNRRAEDALFLEELEATDFAKSYENEAWLPIGFMADDSMADVNFVGNPFKRQNAVFRAATGLKEDVFEIVDIVHVGHENLTVTRSTLGSYNYTLDDKTQEGVMKYNYEMPRYGQLYVYVDCHEAKNLQLLWNEQETIQMAVDTQPAINCAGYFAEGELISFKWNVGTEVTDNSRMYIYAALIDQEVFQRGMEKLADETLQVESFSADHITGTIQVKEDGYFYTSIPYEKGWTLYVDGEEAEITPWQDAFIALEGLEAGSHTIELKFVPHGFKPGAAISLGGVLLFSIAILLERKRKYKNKNYSY